MAGRSYVNTTHQRRCESIVPTPGTQFDGREISSESSALTDSQSDNEQAPANFGKVIGPNSSPLQIGTASYPGTSSPEVGQAAACR